MPPCDDPPRPGGALVVVRAFCVAFVAFAVGVIAHVAAGGLLPGAIGLIVLALSLMAGCASALHARASTVRIVLLVAGGQLWTHLWLSISAGHVGASHEARPPSAARGITAVLEPEGERRRGSLLDLHEQAMARQLPATDTSADELSGGLAHLLTHLSGSEGLMTLAHLIAAALIGCWLARGERALFQLLDLGAARLTRTTVLLAVGRAMVREISGLLDRPHPKPTTREDHPLPLRTVLRPAPRRGPPVLLVIA